MSLDLVGPFEERVVSLDGWTVPLIQACEVDGGEVSIVIDGRLGYSVPAGQAENVIRLVADVIANAWGYGSHPREDENGLDVFERRAAHFARVPHPTIGPRRMHGIEAVSLAGGRETTP